MSKLIPAGIYKVDSYPTKLYLEKDSEPFAERKDKAFYVMLNIIGENIFVPEVDIVWEESCSYSP